MVVFMSSDPKRCACGVVRSGLDLKRVLAFPGRQFTVQFLCRQTVVESRHYCRCSGDAGGTLACFGVNFVFSLLNHEERMFMAVACLELHLKVAERETNSIVQDSHCKRPLRFSTGAVVSLLKNKLDGVKAGN